MTNENIENIDNKEQKPKKEKKSHFVAILSIITGCCVLFTAIQSVFVFRLTTGNAGIMTYTQGPRDEQETQESEEDERRPLPPVDPEFSIEHAASVYDPNKTTLSTVEIVRVVSPATVSIYIMGDVNGVIAPVFSGTGFLISDDGYVVTNEHVVSDVLEDGAEYDIIVDVPGYDRPIDAQIVGTDYQTDIAVLKVEEQDEPFDYVTLGDSDTLQVGELVVAIGNPLGRLEGTVTVGVVSALGREINNRGYTMELIQTDASINSGNSGGPLINSFGEVIGVTNAKISTGEGLGFAIPISDVADEIESIINNGYVANRPYLGITVGNVRSDEYYGAVAGVFCSEVEPGGPADEAGIMPDDLIVSVDGVEINETDDIIDVRDRHEPGDEIPVVVERNGRRMELTLVIGDSNDAAR
ncbi:MAG: trypsin-like peptidase domain-containing protein [Clostridiales bacterium]|nr:trypsin-like peptidase domain-containing protein [Clostridiales bacterium]